MKALFLALLITLSLFTTQAQKPTASQPCKLTIDKIPAVRGLRLGQPYEYLKTVLPRRFEFEKPDEYGLRRVLLTPSRLETPQSLSGIKFLDLIYLDDSLKSIRINYETDVQWKSNLHFAAAIAEQLNLPREGWLQRDPAYLICSGFAVEVAHATIMPTLRFVDLRFDEEVEKRKAEVEETKRARFRP